MSKALRDKVFAIAEAHRERDNAVEKATDRRSGRWTRRSASATP